MTSLATRADRALATRRRMVRAAYDLFCREGYPGATISAIADRAAVAVPTIYYTFHTKAALLGEALGAAVVGFDRWRDPPPEPIDVRDLLPWHAWWPDFATAETSHAALHIFVEHGAAILQRVAPLVPALHGAAGDPEAAEIVRTSEQRRFESYREVVSVCATRPGGLRPALAEAEAADISFALFSAEAYQSLTARGWPPARCARFFADVLTEQLLAAPAQPSLTSRPPG